MDNGRHEIDGIFTGRNLFSVPDYQRGYAWKDKQWNDFYEDFQGDTCIKNYYYGTVLLRALGQEGTRQKYEIVDGQQRLTTLVIFVKCLTDRLREIEQDEYDANELYTHFVKNKGLYILSLQSEDNDFFASHILDDRAVAEMTTVSQRNLAGAKAFFRERLASCTADDLIGFINRVNAANMLVYLIRDEIEAAMIFETTNDRGKPLTNLEKTKSFLMYKAAVKLPDAGQLIAQIRTRFDAVYKNYAAIESYGIDENSILQYSFIANEEWVNHGKKKEYQHYMATMKAMTDRQEGVQLAEYIDRYTYDIQQTFSAAKKMYMDPCAEFADIRALGRVASFLPLLIKCYRMDADSGKVDYRRICRLCEVFVFRAFVVFGYMSNKLQTTWYELARNFQGDFDGLADRIVDLVQRVGDDEGFLARLQSPNFYNEHGSMDRNYFFWKYENWLRENEQPVATSMSHADLTEKKDKKLTLTIEHIVAQRNSDEQSRVVSPQLPIHVGSAQMFDETYLNAIGNLTIDPQSANASKGRMDVAAKNSRYFVLAPYKCQNELSKFMEDGRWTLQSIARRTEKLLRFAKETWCRFN